MPPVTKLENGLTTEQTQLLAELGQTADIKTACEATGVALRTFRRWIRDDAVFKKAFTSLHSGVLESAKAQIEIAAAKAANVFDEALDATKDVDLELECPHCHGEIRIKAQVSDHATRMKAGEVVLKVSKILKDVKETHGTVTVAALPLHMQIALAAFKRGEPIPPSLEDKLTEMGFIKALPEGSTEGEWHEVDPGNE